MLGAKSSPKTQRVHRMNRYRITLFSILTALIGLIVFPDAVKASGDQIEAARKLMEQGQEAFQQKNYEEAAEHFEAAFDASPFAAFLYNAGLAMEKAEKYQDAVGFYERYLKEEPNAADAEAVKKKIDAFITAIAEESDEESPEEGTPPSKPVVQITETEMKSLISIRTNPKDATIRIISQAGEEVSTSTGPLAQTVNGGTYTIEASHPDYKTVTTDIFVAPGQVYVVVVEMSQGAFLGFLRVISDPPGAAVYIDDKRLGQVGVTPFSSVLPAESHKVWVEKPGYLPMEKEILVNISEEVEYNAPMERPSFGALVVKTNINGAKVLIDGKKAGSAGLNDPFRTQLPVGKHTVLVRRDGMKDYTHVVDITPGQERKLLVRLNSKPSKTSGIVSASFAAAVFVAGGVFGFLALDNKKGLDSDRKAGRLASDDERIIKGFLWGVGADVSFGVGTIIACMSVYYFLRDPLPPSEGKVQKPADYPITDTSVGAGQAAKQKKAPTSETEGSKKNKPTATRLRLAPLLGGETAGLTVGFTF